MRLGPLRPLARKARDRLRERLGPMPLIPSLVDHFCLGSGLEIGAGKTPYSPRDRTTYLDKNVDDKDATENADIISDANTIPRPDQAFDFVLSSHVLEHMPNTIGALTEWLRVLKPGGVLFLVLPHAERTFDRCRQLTSLEHHIRDHEQRADEADRSHFDEMKAGWLANAAGDTSGEEQYRREWGADPWDWDFRIAHGVLHYHVWTQNEIVRLLQYLGLAIVYVEEHVRERPDSFIVIARKSGNPNHQD